MRTIGIICEYNPLHLGHQKQFRLVRQRFGTDCAIVCLMSGNYVQRGHPAAIDKTLRAKAAVLSGADLVLELPVQHALSSAEGFAAGGVEILSKFCDGLCFGSESGDVDALMETAEVLLSQGFSAALRQELEKGLSFPAARQAALEAMGVSGRLLTLPNDILAVEYCKAMVSQGSVLQPVPILREGSYHAVKADLENPSATAIRGLMMDSGAWLDYIPPEAREVFRGAPRHTLASGERAVLTRLRTMTQTEFEALPYGSEGLWRKLMHASRTCGTLEEILTAAKSKRYTRTRLDRMVMCAFLGIRAERLEAPVPYIRVLALNDTGRTVLKQARRNSAIVNAGEAVQGEYWEFEKRCGDLYGLFCAEGVEAPGSEERRRVSYQRMEA